MKFEQAFIVGCGYVGSKLATRLLSQDVTVRALARRAESVSALRSQGIVPVAGDLEDIWSLRRLDLSGQVLFYLAPPPANGNNDVRMRTFVNAIAPDKAPQKAILISTTGVYGNCDGAWIDEDAPLSPQTERARRRIDAENVFRAWARGTGFPCVVLRVAGIYGPDRLPLARLRRGEPLVNEQECSYTNRVHVQDLVSVCIAAAVRGRDQQIFNVSDGSPGTMTGYFFAVADAVGLPRPPTITLEQARAKLSPGMLSYMSESRRLRNDKVRQELKVEFQYPDLSAGLTDLGN